MDGDQMHSCVNPNFMNVLALKAVSSALLLHGFRSYQYEEPLKLNQVKKV